MAYRSGLMLASSTAFLWLLAVVPPAAAQGDPIELQQRGIARLDAYIDHYRKTGDRQSRLPDLAQADVELSASNQALAARGDWSALALGLIKRGSVYRVQAQWEPAIQLYVQAEEAAKRARNPVHQSDALTWRSLAESSRGNVGPAAIAAAKAVRLAETAGDPDVLARALGVLGTAQVAQGDLAAAAQTSDREVEIAARAKEPIAPFQAYMNRHDVYMKTAEKCDYQRSFEPCHQALDRARADLEQALSIVQRLGYSGLASQTQEILDMVEGRRALVQVQEDQHKSRMDTLFHPRKPSDVLVTDRFVMALQVPDAVVQYYQERKRAQQQAGGFADVAEGRTQYTEGMMHEMRGENDAALASFLKAIDIVERDRRSLRDERSRGAYMEDRVGFYYSAVQQLLERRDYDKAFDVFERSRSRALADLLATRKLGLTRPEERKLYGELALLRTRLAEAQGSLFEMVSRPGASPSPARLGELQNRIRTLEDQHRQVLARMAVDAPRLQSLVTSTPASLEALQASMRQEGYEMLQYLVLESTVLVWHIRQDSVVVRNVFLPRTQVMRKVAALQNSLSDPNVRNVPFDETTAQELFLYLVQPVLSRIRSHRLVIVPHEDLQYVPFQVFKNPADGRYLGERFQITYAPSASVLLGLKPSSKLTGGRLLAVADPKIAASSKEVNAISKLFAPSSKVVSARLPPESDVKAWVRDFDVIHLAVHGEFNPAEPMLSDLRLAASAKDDGHLTAAEVFGLPLDRSRIVVLAACETGRAEATHGNEILGMVRALLYSGAETLILSYWRVNSEATALWMQSFYQAARSRPMPEAARVALATVKSRPEYSHPYYWAAFAMVGR